MEWDESKRANQSSVHRLCFSLFRHTFTSRIARILSLAIVWPILFIEWVFRSTVDKYLEPCSQPIGSCSRFDRWIEHRHTHRNGQDALRYCSHLGSSWPSSCSHCHETSRLRSVKITRKECACDDEYIHRTICLFPRTNFFFGIVIKRAELAFSAPTDDGRRLFKKYSRSHRLFIYWTQGMNRTSMGL